MTRMYGPAVRCKRFPRSGGCGLASMYPVSDWSFSWLPTIMDISARASSLADRPQKGHSGHQCSHAPGRPILHFVSSSRRPRRETLFAASSIGCHSSLSFVRALLPFPSSRPAHADAPRARGRQRLAVALVLPLAPLLPGHALTGPSTARWSSWSGRHLIRLNALEGAPLVKNCPGDAGELVRERNRQHVVMQPLSCGLDPRLEPIAVPMLWPDLDQHDPGGLNEQTAQITIAALRYAAEDCAVTSRYLFRHQPEPGTEVAAFRESIAGADRGHHRARDDRANARDRHQPLAALVLTSQPLDLAGEAFDALIEAAPVGRQVLDEAQHAR